MSFMNSFRQAKVQLIIEDLQRYPTPVTCSICKNPAINHDCQIRVAVDELGNQVRDPVYICPECVQKLNLITNEQLDRIYKR